MFAAIQDEKAQTKEEKRLEVTRAQDIGGKVPCVGSSENTEVASSLASTNFDVMAVPSKAARFSALHRRKGRLPEIAVRSRVYHLTLLRH